MSQTLIFSGGGPWTLDDARFVQTKSLGIGVFDGLDFDTSGNSVFVCTSSSKSIIKKYDLSTPWDISTAATVQKTTVSGALSAQVVNGFTVRPNGLTFYVTGEGKVERYALTSAWNISGATLAETVVSLATVSAAAAMALSSDGLKMFVSDKFPSRTIEEFALTSAWTISANSRLGAFSITGSQIAYGLDFSDDGKTMFLLQENGVVRQYALSSAWSLGSVTPGQAFNVVPPIDIVNAGDVVVVDGGTRMYIAEASAGGPAGQNLFQYSL